MVDGRDGEPVFTDGPYLESKEHIIGFWIIEAPHLDVAPRLAALGSKNCNRSVELRPILAESFLAEVDGLPLRGYRAFHATRADLLRRLHRSDESRAAYDRAIELAGNAGETAYLIRRRDQLTGP